ncbi:MAG: BlaI/MecI/CopY family transcriptional regulator [Oscillospiraceae bacterium]|nr:BlaI/MecI/CopY family transcriptional regulator [Oscillospiraceae bacterium]
MYTLAEKISDSELEVMHVLWDAGAPLPVADIRRELQARRGWESTTIKTLVQRLVTKGAIAQEKREIYYYTPLVTEKEYNDWATERLVRKLYRGSAKNLVAALVRADELTKEDIDELRSMLEGK